ncbi:YeeE/YedE family protein [Oceanicella actignis]|uniref:Uncharacterized protein n=1 Tax=Oceanicella actignis TaxID=1189325 RepID=A0A1M7S9Q7_9RHOB|nr:YeeE/YedE family protein [Oceanicella actignis]SET30547.1 hypothetical protein SAMN04488119_103408 [Oceanicella actignis]SHN55211.1 hypothetical protein SAMN05216200_102100 [Oceanicella actignis]
MAFISEPELAALAGLAGGAALGLAARLGRFCTLGAVEDAMLGGDWTRARMWALALATAIGLTQLAAALGLFSPADSIYLRQAWNPAATILGGLAFGYGMALAGGCGYGALARLGGGDLRALVIVLVMGVSAYMTIGGPLGWLREALFPPRFLEQGETPPTLSALIGAQDGTLAAALTAALALAAFAPGGLARRPAQAAWAATAGAAVAAGWVCTGLLAARAFEPIQVESHTFAAPLGETLLYLMTATGAAPSFGVGSVAGVTLGALAGSLVRGQFRWEACDDAAELGRQMLGAFLMGAGGVTALGCSVGQGLSAFSTLATSAPAATLAMAAGAALGLRQLVRGFHGI